MTRLLIASILLAAGVAEAQEDFAQIGRFAEENAALGPPARGEERVVFMGDSITEGWSRASPGFFDGRPYVERGISGQTTPQMLLRFRADVVDLEPAVVVILAGTNDIAGNTGPMTNEMIEGNLASMAEIAAGNGIRVVLASILPTDHYPWAPEVEPAPRVVAVNRWLEDYAERNGHVYLDYYSAMADATGGLDERYTYDGVHPNGAGYEVMQGLVEAAIAEALARPGPARFGSNPGAGRR
jgi:lysophospholipase L1-like esterase